MRRVALALDRVVVQQHRRLRALHAHVFMHMHMHVHEAGELDTRNARSGEKVLSRCGATSAAAAVAEGGAFTRLPACMHAFARMHVRACVYAAAARPGRSKAGALTHAGQRCHTRQSSLSSRGLRAPAAPSAPAGASFRRSLVHSSWHQTKARCARLRLARASQGG